MCSYHNVHARSTSVHARSSIQRVGAAAEWGVLHAHDGLQIHEFVEAVAAQFAAVAGALDAAEGGFGSRGEHLVYCGHAGLDVADEALLLGRIVGPDRGTEAEGDVVGDA